MLPGVLLAALFAAGASAADRPEWDTVAVLQIGAERPHATMMVYPSAELARAALPRRQGCIPPGEGQRRRGQHHGQDLLAAI